MIIGFMYEYGDQITTEEGMLYRYIYTTSTHVKKYIMVRSHLFVYKGRLDDRCIMIVSNGR